VTTAPIDLTTLAVGARVQDTFLVWEVETRSQGDGSRFVILGLANASGRLRTAPFWSSELHKVEGLARGAIVRVTGEVSAYKGDRQLKVTAIDPVPPGTADLTRLVPAVEGGVAKYWATLDKWRAEMREGPWKRAVNAFYEDPDFRRAYEQCPGSTGNHHALLGGLLQHTVEVGAIARTIAKTCEADGDLVLAGVLLHDVGKLEAYRWDGVFVITDPGYLVGHVVLGAMELDRRLGELDPPLADREEWLLLHLVLSHHGELAFGSPVRPMTVEAEVLHAADHASATTTNMADAIRGEENFEDGEAVSKRIWSLERKVYRGPEPGPAR
jgi:3'-5' exoribonuclease